MIALLKSYIEGDEGQIWSIALQSAVAASRQGHKGIAETLFRLVDEGKKRSNRSTTVNGDMPGLSTVIREDLEGLVVASQSSIRLRNMVLSPEIREQLERVILEHQQREKLYMYRLKPRNKLLLIGPPGTGKSMTAQALAGELKLPLMTVLLEGVISKFLGETAAKLKRIFTAMETVPGVYFFDEFDAIGAKRDNTNDVGEIRRVLNSFLQLLENTPFDGLIVAATNHPELLDNALNRRFDDVIVYTLADSMATEKLLRIHLDAFNTQYVDWPSIVNSLQQYSQAEIVKIALDTAKTAVLKGDTTIHTKDLLNQIHTQNKHSLQYID